MKEPKRGTITNEDTEISKSHASKLLAKAKNMEATTKGIWKKTSHGTWKRKRA